MTGYVRKDTANNIADGNVVNASDLDNEFDGVVAAFNISTGHSHGGATGEGAPILTMGPTQDVTVSATLMAPKTTNTVDIGSTGLKFKDLYLAGNASVGGTLSVTGVATFTAQPILSSLTASRAVFSDGSKGLVSNAITGTGDVVMSNSPTLVTPALGTPASGVVTNLTGTASININGTVGATTANTGAFTTLSASSTVSGAGFSTYLASPPAIGGTAAAAISATTLTTSSTVTHNGGTANGVGYLNGSKVLTTGSALVFDGTNLVVGNASALSSSSGRVDLTLNGASSGGILSFGTGGVRKGYIYQDSTDFTIANEVAGAMRFINNGSERMRLDSSGNLGLGVTPSAWNIGKAMQIGSAGDASLLGFSNSAYLGANTYYNGAWIYAATAAAGRYQINSGAHSWYTAASGTAGNAITFTQAMTLDASGNLLVGQTSTGLQTTRSLAWVGTGDGTLYLSHSTANASGDTFVSFGYNGTKIGSITQSGTTAVLYNVTSDQRLKENIVDADSASTLIDALQVRQFDWKTDNTHQRYGFVAQELVTIVPEAVNQPTNPDDMMAVDYSKLVPMLVKEIQSLRQRVAQLESN